MCYKLQISYLSKQGLSCLCKQGLIFQNSIAFLETLHIHLCCLLNQLKTHDIFKFGFLRKNYIAFTNCHALYFRYKVGQRFGRHIDESNDLGDGKRTRYTLLVYLSGGPGEVKSKAKNDSSKPTDSSVDRLVGGETVFYGSRNSIVAEVDF